MAVNKTLLGTARVIPETGEVGWGSQTTGVLDDLIDVANVNGALNAASQLVNVGSTGAQTPAGSATLVVSASILRVSGSGGAVTLDTTTPIANGEFDGQLLILTGTSDANTVTIQSTGTNMDMNGDVILTNGDSIEFWWDNTNTLWRERGRSN